MENRAGFYRKNLTGEMAYNSFVPSPLPPVPPIALSSEELELLIKANSELTLLEGLAIRIPNINLFVSMYVRKEALLSSQIEGTQATLDDIFDPLIDNNINADVSDVINYIKATEFAVNRLKELPLCNRLVKEIHAVLLENVRGQEKNPGEFRRSQNWIGGQGSTLKTARYIPPNLEDMENAMSDLEKYINADDGTAPLVKAALLHYQFETIHPFLDGNGRVGRLLITLFLLEKKVLTVPALYISYFLKRNRLEYYDRMMEVRKNGDYEQWIKFFLQAFVESAEDAIATIDKLKALHEKSFAILLTSIPKRQLENAGKLFTYLEANPIIDITKTAQQLDLAYNTTSRLVSAFVKLGLLRQSNTKNKNRVYAYEEYLQILRKGTELGV
ncbi:MAG: Fic family protein [Phascolarctobacterium sp.]|nr:Fic family protein [Phascolarctobacterium sp.]MBQ3540463.1 Fic family protein [Phascolarctobacterium sp.]